MIVIINIISVIAAIINNVSDTIVSEGQQANLSCKVSVTADETVGLSIDNNVINTTHPSCKDTFENATRKCSNTYASYNTVLICDYSVSYEVHCTLQVTGAPVNTATTVHCIVGDIQSVGGAGLIVARKYIAPLCVCECVCV